MFIQTENTPNPATVKFLPGQDILPGCSADFKNSQEAEDSPLAQRLFSLQGVKGVFLSGDFVSVTKESDTEWAMLKPMVLAALMEHLSTGQPIVGDDFRKKPAPAAEDDELSAQIRELLETRVRPMVMMDGGDIVFERFEGGVVYVQMHGACSGCPSSTATLKAGIENMLRHYVPEVSEVRPVEG